VVGISSGLKNAESSSFANLPPSDSLPRFRTKSLRPSTSNAYVLNDLPPLPITKEHIVRREVSLPFFYSFCSALVRNPEPFPTDQEIYIPHVTDRSDSHPLNILYGQSKDLMRDEPFLAIHAVPELLKYQDELF
jgi:hypothetical protein